MAEPAWEFCLMGNDAANQHWTWRRLEGAEHIAAVSTRSFGTLHEAVSDAKRHGYAGVEHPTAMRADCDPAAQAIGTLPPLSGR